MIDNLICGLIWLCVALAVIVIYRRMYRGDYYTHDGDPIFLSPDDPSDVCEGNCIQEQRRSGRERGGPIIWRSKDD